MLTLHTTNIQAYLKPSPIIDYDHPTLATLAAKLAAESADPLELIRHTYTFVRDNIGHSVDKGRNTVPCKASDVFQAQHGLCYAKAHLLAALLRANHIPTGFCYQLLQFQTEAGTALALHGLNAVYVEAVQQWIRLDARGNKKGVDAQFSTRREQLAYTPDPAAGEKDFLTIFAEPDAHVVHALTSHGTLASLLRQLPCQLGDMTEEGLIT